MVKVKPSLVTRSATWTGVVAATAAVMLGACARTGDDFQFRVSNQLASEFGDPVMTRAEWEENRRRQIAAQAAFEAKEETEAGFVPAISLTATGAEIRRARFRDPYLALRYPGVTLSRAPDGRSSVTLSWNGQALIGTAVVATTQWDSLSVLETAAFARPTRPARRRAGDPRPRRPSVCHGHSAIVERVADGQVTRASGHACDTASTSRAVLAYADKLAEIAVTSVPACAAQQSGPWLSRLGGCAGSLAPRAATKP